jgi:hypothetical protein
MRTPRIAPVPQSSRLSASSVRRSAPALVMVMKQGSLLIAAGLLSGLVFAYFAG